MSNLGELPEHREQRLPGVGYSHGKPNAPARPADPVRRISATSQSFFIGTTANVVLNANVRRAYLLFQNRGSATIYIGFSVKPGDSGNAYQGGIELLPGGIYEPNTNSLAMIWNDVFAIAQAANTHLVIVEGLLTEG